jgi:hypothetical protein
MAINSRTKGKTGELEVRDLIKAYGFKARRGQQYSGGGTSPDVVHSIPGVHVEVKRVETFNLYKALAQAKADAAEGDMPTVWHRRSREEWVVVLPAKDFLRLVGGVDKVTREMEDLLS